MEPHDEWKRRVLSSVQEVLNHPLGGMVKIFVFAAGIPGRRKVKPVPFLKGREESETTVDIDDD